MSACMFQIRPQMHREHACPSAPTVRAFLLQHCTYSYYLCLVASHLIYCQVTQLRMVRKRMRLSVKSGMYKVVVAPPEYPANTRLETYNFSLADRQRDER